ncbi:hypothetical protein ACFL96_04515 [Thermoproteota archaeon]
MGRTDIEKALKNGKADSIGWELFWKPMDESGLVLTLNEPSREETNTSKLFFQRVKLYKGEEELESENEWSLGFPDPIDDEIAYEQREQDIAQILRSEQIIAPQGNYMTICLTEPLHEELPPADYQSIMARFIGTMDELNALEQHFKSVGRFEYQNIRGVIDKLNTLFKQERRDDFYFGRDPAIGHSCQKCGI